MKIDVGDLVRVENFNVDDAENDPNGFTGIVSSWTLLENDAGDVNYGETVYSVSLPVAWAKNKYEWTFKTEELVLLEQNVVQ